MELQCEFSDVTWYFGKDEDENEMEKYTCRINSATITKFGTEISAIIGEHLANRSNNDVTGIYTNASTIHYFPRGLHKIFPNLESLEIGNCGLKEITREDLVGLEKLEDLSLHKNKLHSLPSDLFEGMTNLKGIRLDENKLEFLSSELLEPIADNESIYVDLCNNTKIDAFYQPGEEESVGSLQELMDIIDKNCEPPKEDFAQNFAVGLKELWTSKYFSDFIVIGGVNGSSKEFAVHKNILSTQSSVMLATFKNDLKEAQTGKMEIDDFSADVVEGMLKFMYSGEVEDESIAMDLYAIANKYDVENLKSVAENIIFRNILESNAIEVFGFAHLHNSVKIKRRAFREIKKMFPDVEFDNEAMENPGNLKKFIEVHRKWMEIQAEMKSTIQLFEKKIQIN